eukprot:g7795.t1
MRCLGGHSAVGLLLLSLLLAPPTSPGVDAQQETLIVTVQPAKAIAGEPFEQQPVVQLLDSSGQPKLTSVGYALVFMENSPTGFSEIKPPADRGYLTSIGNVPTPGFVRFPFVEGIAIISGLQIDDVGDAFMLRIESPEHAVQVWTSEFAVALGRPYKVALTVQPGTADGGTEFRPQPTVAIQDKGGNVVTNQNSGTVTVSIALNPVAGVLSAPTNGFTLTFNQGIAPFQALKINTNGSPYSLQFVTNLALDGATRVESFPFTVGVGDAYTLRFLVTPSGMAGGTAFVDQPQIEVLDRGGNRLVEDSISKIRAFIGNNPSGGTLSPFDDRLVQLVNGVATFNNLRIDRVGNDYSLRFYLLKNRRGTQIWDLTTLYVDSPNFNVVLGAPQALAVSTPPSNAWAGGSPIGVQPILELRDLGDNVIRTDGTSQVTATITPSIAVASSIVVNTAAAADTKVVDVLTSKADGEYGVGEVIDVCVAWDQDVTVVAAADGRLPELLLDAGATAVATCVTVGVQARKQCFRYVVQAGHASADLNYASTTALALNGATITDGNAKSALLALPALVDTAALGPKSAMVINTAVPHILSVKCTLPGDGRYGAGEILDILVDFTLPLAIVGLPLAGGLLQDNNALEVVTVAPKVDDVAGIVAHKAAGTYTTGDVIFIDVQFTEPVVVTGIPRLLLETNPAAAASDTPADYVGVGSGTKVLRFKYEVRLTDQTADLDVHSDTALSLNGGTVLRHVNRGTAVTATDLSLASARAAGASLADNLLQKDRANLVIDGSIATVTSIGFDMTTPCATSGTYKCGRDPVTLVGDTIDLKITFSADVVVDTTDGTPSVEFETSDIDREASYVSGSGTNQLTFRYTVMLGDDTPLLDYQQQTSLQMKNKYENMEPGNMLEGYIRRKSQNPTAGTVNVVLPLPSGSLSDAA